MLTALLLFFPLLVSVVVLAMKPAQARSIAFAGAVLELVLSVYVALQFDKSQLDQFGLNKEWISTLGISFSIGMDGISLLLVLLTTVLTPLIVLSAFKDTERPASFYSLIMLMQSALIGVFTAKDGFLFYLFWEIALIPVYFICLVWGGENKGKITLKFFIYTLTGSLFMLVALIYLYFKTPGHHTFAIQSLYDAGRALEASQQTYVFFALFFAFAIKMPIFPLHTWQPDTYTVAPVQGTMLLSGIMLKMGIYGVIRWLIPVVPQAAQRWGYLAIILSVVGIIYASCIAIVQKDFKRLIAYSSIAHVGLISGGLFTLSIVGLQGAMVQMLSHGIVVFGLFYIIEIVEARTKTRELAQLGGIRNVAPILASVFLVIMLGSVALPLTSGFIGEFLLISSLVQYKLWIGAVAGLTIILGAVYMLRTFQKSMLGETNGVTALLTDLSGQEKLVLFPVVVLVILIGVYPTPLLSISEVAASNLLSLFSDLSASVK